MDQDYKPSGPTPFERRIDAVATFRFRDLFVATAPEGICSICQEKFWGWALLCDRCRAHPER